MLLSLLAEIPEPVARIKPDFLLRLGESAAFAVVGIALAVFGFKLFDWLTPGDLQREAIEHKNVAAGILSGAVVLGICVIIAASIY